jgi:hypothetical protein
MRSWRANLAPILVLVFASALLSACGDIKITDKTAAYSAPAAQRLANVADAPQTQETHDLAIAAVDFDPALDVRQILSGRPYALLVAVENKGNRREGPFNVSAQLLTQDRQQVLVSAQRSVPVLAAGDITLVRFPNETTPPLQRSYILKATVQPVAREVNTGNNERMLEIDVNTSN